MGERRFIVYVAADQALGTVSTGSQVSRVICSNCYHHVQLYIVIVTEFSSAGDHGQCHGFRQILWAEWNFFDPIFWLVVLFFSRPWFEGWPHHGRTFSIYLCPLLFWLTLPQGVLSASWCCPFRPCVVFLACVHLALFFALSLSPGNSLVSSWCDYSMRVSLLWQCLTVPSLHQLWPVGWERDKIAKSA